MYLLELVHLYKWPEVAVFIKSSQPHSQRKLNRPKAQFKNQAILVFLLILGILLLYFSIQSAFSNFSIIWNQL